MASICKDPGGRKRILFVDLNEDRKAIRLGKASLESAREVKHRVEQLLEAALLKRAMPSDLAKWVADLEPKLAKKLACVGLIPEPEDKSAATLGAFCASYIAGRANLKPNTKRNYDYLSVISARIGR